MAKEEKIYERVTSAEQIIKALYEKYGAKEGAKETDCCPLWRINPASIAVFGITNKERNEKSKVLAKVAPVKGVHKALSPAYNYTVELYWSDWNVWTESMRQWVLFKALASMHEDGGKLVKADCTEYRMILDVVGVDWETRIDLPDLLNADVAFKKELLPGMDEYENEGEHGGEEDEEGA